MAVATTPFWDEKLAALDMKQRKVKRKRTQIFKRSEDGPNGDGSMTPAEIRKFMEDLQR